MNKVYESWDLGERRPKTRVPYERAIEVARAVRRAIKPISEAVVITGSIRRKELEIGDIEIVALPKSLERFVALLRSRGFAGGDRIMRGIVEGLKTEVYIAHEPDELGGLVLWTSGDSVFNVVLNTRAKRMGFLRNPYGIWKGDEPVLQSPDEREFFDFLGMDWHDPEERSLATRSELAKILRALREADLTPKLLRFVEKAQVKLRDEKYIPMDVQAEIRNLAKKHLGWGTVKLGADKLIELGAEELVELGDDELGVDRFRDWSPRGPRRRLFPSMGWTIERWREPDLWDGITGIWYGPEGRTGDYATEIVAENGGWTVCDYYNVTGEIQNAPSPILKKCTFVDFAILAQALAEARNPIPEERIAPQQDYWMLYAVSLGVAQIQYHGGDEEWEDSLP